MLHTLLASYTRRIMDVIESWRIWDPFGGWTTIMCVAIAKISTSQIERVMIKSTSKEPYWKIYLSNKH